MQIKDLEDGQELGRDEKSAVVGGAVTETNVAGLFVSPGVQAGNSGFAFASPVINTSVVVPVISQVNTGINLETLMDNDVATLVGSIGAIQQ